MGDRATKARVHYICVAIVMSTALAPAVGYAQPENVSRSIQAFSKDMVGDWVGTVEQSTDGQKTDVRYFHASAKQIGPGLFQTTLECFKTDHSGVPVEVGKSTMTTRISADGTAVNTIVGDGEVQLDPNTEKNEQHRFTETLRPAASGCLQGSGSGNIDVCGMPFGLGKNGKVRDYRSTWSLSNGILKISQRFKVGFKVLFAGKSYTVTNEFEAKRGSDITSFMTGAGAAKAP